MPIVEVKGLCKAFGDNQVLNNLDFQIEKGEVVTLIGPSGGGKTTLLRSLNWLNVPDAGRVTIDGVTIEAGKRINNRSGHSEKRQAWYFSIIISGRTRQLWRILQKD